MINQFYTICKHCGKQILMTRCESNGRWIPCDPYVMRFTPGGGPETFISTNGELCYGRRSTNGEVGYRKHRRAYSV